MPLAVAQKVTTVCVFAAAAAWVACLPLVATETPQGASQDSATPGELPSTARECLALADRLGHEGASRAELRLALRALERAETLSETTVELLVKQIRLLFFIAEPRATDVKVMPWLNRGDQLAKRLVSQAPERVEGHYFRAVFLGFRAQLQEVGGMDLLPDIVESAQKAVDLDPAYDDAGPLALMGMLLVRAPAWPHGIGNPEEGLALLQRSVSLSDYPLNRLVLAKALFLHEQRASACRQAAKVLAAPRRGRWAKTGARHRRDARLLASSQRCSEAARQ